MARLVTSGAEIQDHVTTDAGSPDGWTPSAAPTTTETTIVRSGRASWKFAGTAANASYRVFSFTAPAAGVDILARPFIYIETLPSSTTKLVSLVTAADGALISARVTSAGVFQLFNDVTGVQIGSDLAVVTASVGGWYRIQLRLRIGAGAVDQAELRVQADADTTIEDTVTASSLTISDTQPARLRFGWIDAPGATVNAYGDDVAVNNSTGNVENSWPGAGRIVLSRPVWGSWTAATATDCSGAAPDSLQGSNMVNAANNLPPRGAADHTTAGHAADPDQWRLTSTSTIKLWCETYPSVGQMGDIDTPSLFTNAQIGTGSTATTLHGDVVAQSFLVNGTLESIDPAVFKTGAPADDLIIDLVEDNGGLPTGQVIESWTFASASIQAGAALRGQVLCRLTYPVAAGRTLWLVMHRSGVNDATNYFSWSSASTEFFTPGFPAAQQRAGAWTAPVYANHTMTVHTSQGKRQPKVVVGWFCHGEAVVTGTKTWSGFYASTGSLTSAVTTSGNIGNDAGAAGTYPSLWTWSASPTIYRAGGSAAYSLGGPRLTWTVASATRFSLICFAGVYSEFDEVSTGTWTRLQKTSDSSIWWGKQAVADMTLENASGTPLTVPPGEWALYPDPQPSAGSDLPATLVTETDTVISANYTYA